MKPRILYFTNWYEPGYNGGGSQLAAINHVHALSEEYDFNVVTRDRDLASQHPYANIVSGSWTSSRNVRVRYLAPEEQNLGTISDIVNVTKHDLIHLNSVFSPAFSFLPIFAQRRMRPPRGPIVISPHGELAPSALARKAIRKTLYLAGAKYTGILRDVIWHATSKFEADDIATTFGESADVEVAAIFASVQPADTADSIRPPKCKGRLRAVFLSRIDRIKNLHLAINLIANLSGITLDIFGPIEQLGYWSVCLEQIRTSARPDAFRYCGSVAPSRVLQTLSGYDVLLLPSQGESFGYAILEALLAGCPVLISDRTPWRGLKAAGTGDDIPLDQLNLFRARLTELRDLDEAGHSVMRARARSYARNYVENSPAKEAMRAIYTKALARST